MAAAYVIRTLSIVHCVAHSRTTTVTTDEWRSKVDPAVLGRTLARLTPLAVIEGRDLAKLGNFAFDDKFQVELAFGDQPRLTTKLQKRRQAVVPWNKAFTLYVLSSFESLLSVAQDTLEHSIFSGQIPELVLEVYAQSSVISSVQFIGRTNVSYTDLALNGTPDTGRTLAMFHCHLCIQVLI